MPADWIIKINIDGINYALAHKDGRGYYPARNPSNEDVLYWSSLQKAQETLDFFKAMHSLILNNETEVAPYSSKIEENAD